MNLCQRIGGDSDLSPRGELYAKQLPGFFAKHVGDRPAFTVHNLSVVLYITRIVGLDEYTQAYDSNGGVLAVPQVAVEVTGRD